MEVMFSIGVLLIGIVGLAHVLPIGMHQSADAVSADKSLIAMENLVSRTLIQAEISTREGFVIADRWSPVNSTGLDNYFTFQPSADDYRYGICVDPWFLSSAYNKRNPTNTFPAFDRTLINGYDRALFPCYDRNYNPLESPSESLYTTTSAPSTAWGDFNDSLWRAPPGAPYPTGSTAAQIANLRPHEPRFLRVSPAVAGSSSFTSVAPRHESERAFAAQSAEPAMILPDGDKTLPAGRRFLGMLGSPVAGSSVGRYSALSFIVSHEDDADTLRVSTAITKNRIPTTDPSSTGSGRFYLGPYTYNSTPSWPTEGPYYEGEQLAYVQTVNTATMASFASGLGGQVEIVMHRAAGQSSPRFRSGQYLMFMRHVYPIRAVASNGFASSAFPGPDRLEFDWFKIADVVGDPATDLEGEAAAVTTTDPVHGTTPDVWRVTLDLRGPSWLFDDSSRLNFGTYNYTPDTYQDATYVVWMPDVVGVHERTVSLTGR